MKNNVAKIVLLFVGLISLAGLLWFYFPSQNKLTRITVLGDSKTKIAPDTAIVTFSVVTKNKQALVAQQENAQKSEAVKKAVENIIKDAVTEIKTSGYSLNPEENYSLKSLSKIVGYEVTNTVSISVKDLNKVGEVIDAATKAGANSVEGISFVVGETSPSQGNALSLATKQAMAKAESIAKSLNGKIVRVVETREGGTPNLGGYDEADSMYMNSNTATADRKQYNTPIQAGSLEVRSQVVLVVEIKVG